MYTHNYFAYVKLFENYYTYDNVKDVIQFVVKERSILPLLK